MSRTGALRACLPLVAACLALPPAAASTTPAGADSVAVVPKALRLAPCTAADGAFLHARLAGALERELDFRGTGLSCDGMRRPDGKGLRVSFAGWLADERLTLVFGVPRLGEGASGHAVPVNVTLIRDGGQVYGTRGEGRCMLDEVEQTRIDAPAVVAAPASSPDSTALPAARHASAARPSPPSASDATGASAHAGSPEGAASSDAALPRRWRIDARGFCLDPARAVVAGTAAGDAILLATFDFRGQLEWEPDPPDAVATPDPASR